YGYPVFIADFAKGIVSVVLATQIARSVHVSEALLDVVAAVCCVLGNAFQIWLGFRGGKGVAVSAGLMFALMPVAAVIVILVWLVLFYLTRYVSLASILAAVCLPVTVFLLLHF